VFLHSLLSSNYDFVSAHDSAGFGVVEVVLRRLCLPESFIRLVRDMQLQLKMRASTVTVFRFVNPSGSTLKVVQ
jgi:ABC-type microcin C transport system permease subunit YejE